MVGTSAARQHTGAHVEEKLALDDQLCFALYAASRAMTARYRPGLDALGLTYPQYLVMVVLWDGGQASVRELGDRLRLDSGTLSPLLKRLERNGLITRVRSIDDERATIARPTAKGTRLRERAAAIPAGINDALADVIDAGALREELRLLEIALRAI